MSRGDAMLDELCARIDRLEQRGTRQPIDAHANDERWDCVRCEQLLALVDTETGRFRFQVREFNVQFVPARGEAVHTKCKRCGWENSRLGLHG